MMKRHSIVSVLGFLFFITAGVTGADAQDKVERADWGAISRQPSDGRIILAVEEVPADGKLPLPTPFDAIVSAYVDVPGRIGPARDAKRVDVSFSGDAKEIAALPPIAAGKGGIIVLETAEKSAQLADGRIIFSALDANVQGKIAKLESHPGNHRIGFWADASDYVTWEYNATRPGMYQVELTYSLAGGESDITITVGDASVATTIKDTGSWYRYTTIALDKLYIAKPGKLTVSVKATKKTGGAVMNFKAVQLRPTGEGEAITQDDDGTVLLHSRDATSRGTKVQYEHKPEKNTLGYWVNVNDQASWTFTINKPGTFEVEILQGCGKGSGGAQVNMVLLETTGFGKDQTLSFTVEDTGHFQNFIPRNIGKLTIDKPGEYTFLVKPMKKPGVAVMDLRQVKLMPAK